MKVKLLKKLRRANVIYKRNKEYKYTGHKTDNGGFWYIDTGWTKDLNSLICERNAQIVEQAREMWKLPKSVL